jgi:hypothetical protein
MTARISLKNADMVFLPSLIKFVYNSLGITRKGSAVTSVPPAKVG